MKRLFAKTDNTQAYLKCGIMGFAGSGKTYTSTQISIGMIRHGLKLGLDYAERPAFFLDTETGSDWVKPQFDEAGIDLFIAKTRSFADLVPAVKEAEQNGSILIIDSVSHFWRELTESYAKKKNRTYGLQFQDWAWLKAQWGHFTDLFINSQLHIVMAGRAGYEYDFFEQEGGKKELEKTGIKMKAETETGYEPSILILMESHMEMDSKSTYRTGRILKDRASLIDGRVFRNPTFNDIRPHVEFLNLGGTQIGVDTSRDSSHLISRDNKSEYILMKEEREILLDEIQTILVRYYPSTSKEDKKLKIDLIEEAFGTISWKRVETYQPQALQEGLDKLRMKLEPEKWSETPAAPMTPDPEDSLEGLEGQDLIEKARKVRQSKNKAKSGGAK